MCMYIYYRIFVFAFLTLHRERVVFPGNSSLLNGKNNYIMAQKSCFPRTNVTLCSKHGNVMWCCDVFTARNNLCWVPQLCLLDHLYIDHPYVRWSALSWWPMNSQISSPVRRLQNWKQTCSFLKQTFKILKATVLNCRDSKHAIMCLEAVSTV